MSKIADAMMTRMGMTANTKSSDWPSKANVPEAPTPDQPDDDNQGLPQSMDDLNEDEQDLVSWWLDLMHNPPPGYKDKNAAVAARNTTRNETIPGTDIPQGWWDDNEEQFYARGHKLNLNDPVIGAILEIALKMYSGDSHGE